MSIGRRDREVLKYYSLGEVLRDLGVLDMLRPCVLSEEEGCEKPSAAIWTKSMQYAGIEGLDASEVVHIGDELEW